MQWTKALYGKFFLTTSRSMYLLKNTLNIAFTATQTNYRMHEFVETTMSKIKTGQLVER